jgi:hypothetical protein
MAAVVFTVDAESATGTGPSQRGGRRGRRRQPDVLIPFASIDPAGPAGVARPAAWSRSTG